MDELINIAKIVAPGISTLLGGPLAGAVVSLIGNKLFGNSETSIEEILKGLKDPETAVKLKDLDTQVLLGKQNIEALELKNQSKEIDNEGKQIDIDLQYAKGDFFDRGPRPALLWSGVLTVINNEIILPYIHGIFPSIVPLDASNMMAILGSLLGFGCLHVYSKTKGID